MTITRQWIDVPKSLLTNNKADAVMVLRLGAFSNAVHTVVLLLVTSFDDPDTPPSERDRMHLFLSSVAFLKEAVDHIQQHQQRLRQLLNAARKNGYEIEKWSAIAPLLTTASNSLYERVLDRVRNQVGFHFKSSVFDDWIANGAPEKVRLWDVHGANNAGRLYRASSDALAYALAEGREASDAATRGHMAEISQAQSLLLRLTEAALIGFIIAAGQDPRVYFGTENERPASLVKPV